MASNVTVSAVEIETYESTLIHLAQQRISRVMPWCMNRGEQSAGHNWPVLNSADATLKGRDQATPETGAVFAERRSVPITMDIGELVEPEDIIQVLIDPLSGLAQSQGYAIARSYDDEIFDAAERVADDGNGGTVALPAGQIVNTGGVGAINFDMVTEVTEKFLDNDVDPDEPKVFFVSPAQVRKMLQLTEVTSADYNSLRPLESGMPTNWMGYTWIPSTRLNSPGAGRVNCIAMTADALGFNLNEGMTARVQEDPTMSFAWRVYARSTFGAVRVQDEKIVLIDVNETI
jgi:hypothetical protein